MSPCLLPVSERRCGLKLYPGLPFLVSVGPECKVGLELVEHPGLGQLEDLLACLCDLGGALFRHCVDAVKDPLERRVGGVVHHDPVELTPLLPVECDKLVLFFLGKLGVE